MHWDDIVYRLRTARQLCRVIVLSDGWVFLEPIERNYSNGLLELLSATFSCLQLAAQSVFGCAPRSLAGT